MPPQSCVFDSECTTTNECSVGSCVMGECSFANVVDNTSCTDDGNLCTNNVCLSGVCLHPSSVSCLVGETCNPGNGLCVV